MSHAWMPFYVGDYLADTGHLSAAEHGAYVLLIMHYWQQRGLPDDEKKIAKLSRLTADQWRDSRDTLADLFLSGWRHKRIEDELARADEIISKRSAAGKAGASARYGHRMAEASQTDAPLPSPLPKEDIKFPIKEKNGRAFDTSALIATAEKAVKRGDKSNYMWLKTTDTRWPKAEKWWLANYGVPIPRKATSKGMGWRVPWEAVR